MFQLSPATRLALGLAGLSITLVFVSQVLGMLPDHTDRLAQQRGRLCEAIAVNVSWLASTNDPNGVEQTVRAIVERQDDLLSAAVRRSDGEQIVEIGPHDEHWKDIKQDPTLSQFLVPIYSGNEPWGTVELRFEPLVDHSLLAWLKSPAMQFSLFFAIAGTFIYWVYLRRMLRYMDPSSVIPDRVRSTLDTLAEGLIVTDREERIVLANQAFGKVIGCTPDDLIGRNASQLPWTGSDEEDDEAEVSYPWRQVISDGSPKTGVTLGMKSAAERKTFLVNSAPILGDDGVFRGSLSSFDDITVMQRRKAELIRMLEMVKRSSEKISEQNRELELLATHDPLTSCMNRRSLFEHFEKHWKLAERHRHPLSCVMVDVDHFKSINDTHGHSVGDEVLKAVAATLKETARESDLVARYGGEEFCILLPRTPLDEAVAAGERLRIALAEMRVKSLSVTASLGVSAVSLGADDPQELLDQADKCLYIAKRNGRNQVVSFGDIPEDIELDESQVSRTREAAADNSESRIPFRAVTALIGALGYRDPRTAAHCRRVADYCVLVAEGLMTLSDCYVLEIAALLHDIGKIGVPDSILLKDGELTAQEREVMRSHERMGVEIVRTSFGSPSLTDMVKQYRVPVAEADSSLSLGARILAIADAYDAMTSKHSYRPGMTSAEAFAELRRCAGRQFDEELVERFVSRVSESDAGASQLPAVDKETALSIGLQLEGLAAALDSQDLDGLSATAGHLQQLAKSHGVDTIATQADRLTEAISSEVDLLSVLKSANELLALCRSTQHSFLVDKTHLADPLTA